MAFSFTAGTSWYHDFPKLARESGFYFNMHTARVRVDWNRIGNIDIEKLIRERDFQTIDDNVNNVIDYHFESEYDLKILDPNFVKIFRLAQLAVEYLLYCKQYLDQSIVILKDELKCKINENERLKGDIMSLENTVKEYKHQLKEKTKSFESKTGLQEEIQKCPHCPKTFITAAFAKAHIIRRHSNSTEVFSVSSPVNEEYKVETEKLHNEIKNLKERLNQTEKMIRNDSSKTPEAITTKQDVKDDSNNNDSQFSKYQEEIKNLKMIFFNEIKTLKEKDIDLQKNNTHINQEMFKELILDQEKEIEQLRMQLHDHMKSISKEEELKLNKQEDSWKSKLEQIETQHQNDIEKLFKQLKLTQESANSMKNEYETKITNLEKQTQNQLNLLNAQSQQISSLKKSTNYNQEKNTFKQTSQNKKIEDNYKQEIKSVIHNLTETEESSTLVSDQDLHKEFIKESFNTRQKKKPIKLEPSQKTKHADETIIKNIKKSKNEILDKSILKSENSDISSKTNSSLSYTSESEELQESYSECKSLDQSSDNENEQKLKSSNEKSSKIATKHDIHDIFESRLRCLGIDPEWKGIPSATYKEKVETIKHQQNLYRKSFSKYDKIRKKIIDDVSKLILLNNKGKNSLEHKNKSIINKVLKNVKTNSMKLSAGSKSKKNDDASSSISSKNSTPQRLRRKRRYSLDLLPKKLTDQDLQHVKEQAHRDKLSSLSSISSVNSLQSVSQSPKKQTFQTSTEYPKQVSQHSYQSINDFMRDLESSNFHSSTLKSPVISEPMMSPKSGRSVLKTASGTAGNIKKRVLFDLEQEKNENNDVPMEDYDTKDSDFDNKSTLSHFETYKNNILLKTSQSDRIAEISRQIQEKLEMTRQRPIGSVETMFKQSASSLEKFELSSPKSQFEMGLSKSNYGPKPAPRISQNKKMDATKAEDLLAMR